MGVSIPYPGSENIALVQRHAEHLIAALTVGPILSIFSGLIYLVPDDRIFVMTCANLYTGQPATSVTANPLIREGHVSIQDPAGNAFTVGMQNGYGAVPGGQYPADYTFNGQLYVAPRMQVGITGWYSIAGLGTSTDDVELYFDLYGYTIPLGNTNLNG